MDAVVEKKPVTFNRLLPYWAVFQSDVRQTLRSWVYRFWVLLSVLATVGYLLYSFGIYHEAGIIQSASLHISHLLVWIVLGSTVIICVLTAGSISSERGTMADSVLSRGISRHQYFLGKWHARLATVLGTFFILGVLMLISAMLLLHEDLSWHGSLVGLAAIAALLGAVITCGVTVSAIANSTVLGIAVLWSILCAAGVLLSFLPSRYPTPDRTLLRLPYILQGHYDFTSLSQFVGWAILASCLTALVGLAYFSRRDV
jgi:ABC-type transport system involved in multi-copper enzyme maturation permease subunit